MSGTQASKNIASKLLPTLWASASDKQTANTGPETTSTSFGGTWNWNAGYATLGYWNYSSGKNADLGTRSSGQGFNVDLGAYRSSLGIYGGLSYGQSEETVASWPSGVALYNLYVTVSYQPDKLPGISVTAASGNYDYNAIANGSMSSDLYAMTAKGEYSSLTAGLDLTNLLWRFDASDSGTANKQRPSVKALYRYTDSFLLDSSASKTSYVDSLVAVMI